MRNSHLKILSANVRGFRTNIGELTHNMILKTGADIVATTETFLNEHVENTFGKIKGYAHWIRRDRRGREGGGVAICYKNSLQVQTLEVDIPDMMEAIFLRIVLQHDNALLLCVLYRPQWQCRQPLDFLTDYLDTLLIRHNCQHVVIVGDLNYHLVQNAYDDLLDVQGLVDHVDFPTHIHGGTLDPVISDLNNTIISCSQLGLVGTSDHHAILSRIDLTPARDEIIKRKIWLWDQADWASMKQDLRNANWPLLLTGDTDQITQSLTRFLQELQEKYVPSREYIAKPDDQPWFGYRCRLASDHKQNIWQRLKRNPTRRNRNLFREACRRMKNTSKWAKKKWLRDRRQKLSGPGVGGKMWWKLVKEIQGSIRQENIPPLNRPDGTVASSNLQKAELLGAMFSNKMRVPEPDLAPPITPQLCHETLTNIQVNPEKVKILLKNTNTKKAIGPDDISPHILHMCSDELANPLTSLFQTCVDEKVWPSLWKKARVIPVHKKNSKADPGNYRPISLLSNISKILEKIIVDEINEHLNEHNLLSNRQHGFRPSRSTADLLLLLTKSWQDALDVGLDTVVIALDIAGAFDRVWHKGLLAKLRARGIQGDLIELLENYLSGRTLQVAVGGQNSQQYPITASVPQGSVLGPVLWNIFINDLLESHPEISAYADDSTLTKSYHREDCPLVITQINNKLRSITEWGNKWQVKFAPEKTQAMVISRSPEASTAISDLLKMNDESLQLQDHISILGVDFDKELRFDKHIRKICQTASLKVTTLRRMATALDPKGLLTLYNAQIRPYLEYSALTWMSSAPTHLNKLDKIQRRVLRLAQNPNQPRHVDLLEHRRDVAALTVLHKSQVQQVPHLASLRLPSRTVLRGTRTVPHQQLLVEVPRSRASQHLRTFAARVARLWNRFVSSIDVSQMTTQEVKVAAHRWRRQFPTPIPNLYYT